MVAGDVAGRSAARPERVAGRHQELTPDPRTGEVDAQPLSTLIRSPVSGALAASDPDPAALPGAAPAGVSRWAGVGRAILALQRSAGNSAVQHLLAAPTPLRAAPVALTERARHPLRPLTGAGSTDVPAAPPSAAPPVQRAAPGMPDKLTDDINRILDDTAGAARTDAGMLSAVRAAIRRAPTDERDTARRDPRIVRRLPVDLTRASALLVLRALDATLVERLPTAIAPAAGGAGPTLAVVRGEIQVAPSSQKRAALGEANLLVDLQTALPRPDAMQALTALGAVLREVLNAGMRGAGAESAPMLAAASAATSPHKAEVLADGATMALLRDRLTRADRLTMLAHLRAPFVDRLNATVDGPGAADGAAAVRLATAATATERDAARADRDLDGRLRVGLPPVSMRDVLVALQASLADVLGFVLGTPAGTEADVVRLVGAAAEAPRQAAHDDAALVARIQAAFPLATYWRIRLLLAFGTQAQVDAPSRTVPMLSNGAAYRAGVHLEAGAGERADALRTVMDSLVARRSIDLSLYQIVMDPAGAGDATTTFPGFAQDARTRRFAPTGKPTIKVSPGGFANVSVLVSSIVRECARAVRESQPAATDPTAAGAVGVSTVESLLFEIEHRNESGIVRHGARMQDLGTRLTTAFTALEAAVQRRLNSRYQRALRAVAAVPAGTVPAVSQSLTAALSTELAKHWPIPATLIAAIEGATPAARRPVAENHELVNRVLNLLTRPDALRMLTLLGAPLSQRIQYLVQVGAPQAEIVAAMTGSSTADQRSVTQNRALLDSVLTNVGDAQVTAVTTALGGSLVDELERARRAAAPAPALASSIAAATADQRRGVTRNTALLDRIRTTLGDYEYWKVRLLLEYGTAASYPSAATKLVASFAGGPAIAAIRLAFRRLTDAELRTARTLPGIRDLLRALLPSATDLVISLRMLDQGMLDEETGMGAAYTETLQVANAAGIFVGTQFGATSGFELEYKRDMLECRVRVNVTAATATAGRRLDASRRIWEANIERAWNRKYKVTNANHSLPLVFNVNFTSTSAHHNITAHAGVPVWPGLNMTNWFVDDPSTSSSNRAYVNNAAIHEFGHMIGSPDEYDLSQAHYLGTVGVNPTTDPNATSTTDAAGTASYTNVNSVMGGQLPGTNLPGPVQQRHVNFMLTWINAHRNPAEPVFTIGPA